MAPNEFRQYPTLQPFEPFRLLLSNGEEFTVPHPDLVMVGLRSITVGIPSAENPALYESATQISLNHVERLQRISQPTD